MFYFVSQTDEFMHWFKGVDKFLYFRILAMLAHMRVGFLGDATKVGDYIYEARIASYPNVRIYFYKEGSRIVILFASVAQISRNADIAKAQVISHKFQEEYDIKTKEFMKMIDA